MALIFVVDDNVGLTHIVEKVLQHDGHRVEVYHDAHTALKALNTEHPDLILLDIMMPKMDGLEFCQKVRSSTLWASIPIIFLTAKETTEDKVRGFRAGADDYLTKPFSTVELALRVGAVLRRANLHLAGKQTDLLQVSDLTLDQRNYRVYLADRQVTLTPLEFELLKFLMSHPGEVFNAEDLLRWIWNYPSGASNSTIVRKHIRNLRSKLETIPQQPRYIRTANRHGYVFDGGVV